jgi:hypothetical protein
MYDCCEVIRAQVDGLKTECNEFAMAEPREALEELE